MGQSSILLSRILIFLLAASHVSAEDALCDLTLVEETLGAINRGDLDTAESMIGQCAESGDTASQIAQGLIYYKSDREKTLEWIEKAAQKRNAVAESKFAQVIDNSIRDEEAYLRSKILAFNWHYRAARQGHPRSLYEISKAFYMRSNDPISAYMWGILASRRMRSNHGSYEFANDLLRRIEERLPPSGEGRREAIRLADLWEARHPNAAKSWPVDDWVDNLKGASAAAIPAPETGPIPGFCETFGVVISLCPQYDYKSDPRLPELRRRFYETSP
jgi:TPR repeat protein